MCQEELPQSGPFGGQALFLHVKQASPPSAELGGEGVPSGPGRLGVVGGCMWQAQCNPFSRSGEGVGVADESHFRGGNGTHFPFAI